MTYLDFVKEKLKEYFPIIVEEVGFLNNVDEPEVLVIRKLQGTIFQNSKILPIQFEVKTRDINMAMNILNNFVFENNSQWFISGLNYIKQNYGTPFLQQAFTDSGVNVSGTITVNATLVETENISDIESLSIDGEDIYFDSVQDDYVASEQPQKKYDDNLHRTKIRGGINKLLVSSLQFNNGLLQKVRNIKSGALEGDVPFNVVIKYTDSSALYSYTMKLGSHSAMTSTANVPVTTIALTE